MSAVSSGCCCGGTPTCVALPLCESPGYFAEYITIGRPRAPKKYYGTYFPAWHNTISSRGKIVGTIALTITKRTLVQTDCTSGACPAPAGLSTAASCTATGTVAATPNCSKTVYTDRYNWTWSGTLDLNGLSADQVPTVDAFGDPTAPAPPGHLPCGLGLACGGLCLLGPNYPTLFGSAPVWWHAENRKSLPRFGDPSTTITASAIPSSLYPQVAACGTVSHVNRCPSTTSSITTGVCLDYPMVIVPNDPGNDCNGNPVTCGDAAYVNGSTEALLGMDLVEPNLIAALAAMGLPSTDGIGTWNDFWVCYTQNRMRMLFDVRGLMPTAGTVYKPSAGISISKTAVLDAGDRSWRVDATVNLTTSDWCYADKDCHCFERSRPKDRVTRCEHGPTTLAVSGDFPIEAEDLCAGSTDMFTASMVLGLEGVFRAYPAAWDACFMWNDLPSTSIASLPSFVTDSYRYLGAEPLERGHPFWKRYRTLYNHTETVNAWYTGTYSGGSPVCEPQRSGVSTDLGTNFSFYIDPESEVFPGNYVIFDADTAACLAQCQSDYGPSYQFCCECPIPLQVPPGVYSIPAAGCYTGKYRNFLTCSTTLCEEYCSGFSTPGGSAFSVPGLPLCNDGHATMSSPTDTCNAFFSCGGDDLSYTMIFNLCATADFAICGLTSETAAVVRNIGSPARWLIDDWKPWMSCSPVGIYRPKWDALGGLGCKGPSFWQPNNGAEVRIA